MLINKQLIGEVDGKSVYEYTLKNGNGIEISCLNYGCAITKMITPDNKGNYENIVLGFQDLAAYQDNPIYAGVVVGRIAGRIQDAQFTLDGKTYTLASNDGQNHLHGGLRGFHKVVWDVKTLDTEQEVVIEFSYTSLDGEEGYPGTLATKVTYTLNDQNEFMIHYYGQTDQETLFNPTNHTYFNLSGNVKQDISQHSLKINSSQFLELTQELMPTGKFIDVKDTVFDFRNGRKIKEGIDSSDSQNIIAGRGYDHPFVLDSHYNQEIVLHDEKSGRNLVVESDAVGVVLYTGNQIPTNLDIHGVKSRPYLGLCLETQGLPDSIHHPNFPSCILKKDQKFSTMTKYTFSVG
ncbi:aldose epimerase family protein [Pelosinus sp. sgz500959]|uniref:aldose epimerase family protein n=1 Tax=Pelosinus sp. sgz500959 TaxID=3242472 RepID=UPI003672F21A